MSLSDSELRLMRLFTAAVLGRMDELVRIRRAAPPGEPDRRWREAVLQVHVFAGFPRLVESYDALAAAGGLGEAEPGEFAPESEERLRAHGRELFDRIYADDADSVRALLANHHRDFAAWIESHAYGRVLARPGLSADRRELLAVCALAALGQERQLASHVRGSLRLGATRAELDQALASVSDLVETGRADRAQRVLERFAPLA